MVFYSLAAIWDHIKDILWNAFNRPRIIDVLDIVFVAFLLYYVILLTRQTRASAVLKGFLFMLAASWISGLFGLVSINWILMSILNNGAIVLLVIFHPEIRKALEQLGRGAKINNIRKDSESDKRRTMDEILQSVINLSRRKVGALVVLVQKVGLQDIIDGGIRLNADIHASLLENIFEPNTPLHDGAVIIQDGKIAAAACILPLPEGLGISRDLGTRHRAAIGISETTDAAVIIVSEETGIISLARGGKLTRHLDTASLSAILSETLLSTRYNRFYSLMSLSGLGKKREKEV